MCKGTYFSFLTVSHLYCPNVVQFNSGRKERTNENDYFVLVVVVVLFITLSLFRLGFNDYQCVFKTFRIVINTSWISHSKFVQNNSFGNAWYASDSLPVCAMMMMINIDRERRRFSFLLCLHTRITVRQSISFCCWYTITVNYQSFFDIKISEIQRKETSPNKYDDFLLFLLVRFSRHELNTCWYILLSGSVFIESTMYLPRAR